MTVRVPAARCLSAEGLCAPAVGEGVPAYILQNVLCFYVTHAHMYTPIYKWKCFFFWVKRDRPKHRLSFFPEFWALWRRQMRGRDVSLASAGAVAPMEDATPGLLSCRCCRGSRCRGCRVAPIPAGRIALPGLCAAGMRSSRNLRACFIV